MGFESRNGYHSEDGFSHSAMAEWRSSKYCPPQPTVPEPFKFEERAKEQPTTIMEVKTKQDVVIGRREQKAQRQYEFKANPVPKSTAEPR